MNKQVTQIVTDRMLPNKINVSQLTAVTPTTALEDELCHSCTYEIWSTRRCNLTLLDCEQETDGMNSKIMKQDLEATLCQVHLFQFPPSWE
jgi:hypothetical protein